MTKETKSDRKPRARISVDEHLVTLRDRKRAELEKLDERYARAQEEVERLASQLGTAKVELKRLEAAVGEPVGEAAQ